MYRVIHRIRADRKVLLVQAALIKMVLLSQQSPYTEGYDYEGDFTMTDLDEGNTNIAYLCGRLLAQLDYIQQQALGKVNATISDRFYGMASTSPAVVFPRLIKGATHHLATIRSKQNSPSNSYASSLSFAEKNLGKITSSLTSFPTILTLEEQGRFSLGYLFQKNMNASPRSKNANDTQSSEDCDNTDDSIETTTPTDEDEKEQTLWTQQ